MRIYNTLTRQIEEFKPINPERVTFYHCGPTVYWVQHIGNMRAVVWADLIRRSLQYLSYEVTMVRNYTDVGHFTSDADSGEDKMEKGAKREGLSPKEIADKYIRIFDEDAKRLNAIPPTYNPRASDYIPRILAMIRVLLDRGYAYITDQAIVYDVSKFKNYNQLNRQNLAELIKAAGKGGIENPQKKHFADFNLWVFKKGIHVNALQTWPSPWGEGFPGWHIECSVMAKKLLGDTVDIHMGGVEHISIHHTNEIAQSEAANGTKFANYWLHNAHLLINNEKMAKSQGTGFTLQDIIDKGFNPLSLRYLFLTAHYRSQQNFTWGSLRAAQSGLSNLRSILMVSKIEESHPSISGRTSLSEEKLAKIQSYSQRFKEAIENDLNMPEALAVVWEMAKSNIPEVDKADLAKDFDQVLGLDLLRSDKGLSFVREGQSLKDLPIDVLDLVNQREETRKSGDFAKADQIRNEINHLGWKIKDTPSSPQLIKI